MATYYVGSGGNDGSSGLTWALRKLTLNGAEDVPVVANDTVYVGPGVYREQLTVDVSGGAGTEIVYIGDVTGEHTDSIGGIVRITGSDDDQATARSYCITATTKDYRVFRGFTMDAASANGISLIECASITISDCVLKASVSYQLYIHGAAQADITVQRCLFLDSYDGMLIDDAATVDDTGHVIENCVFQTSTGIRDNRVGGITVRNCSFLANGQWCVRILSNLSAGQTLTVNNCILQGGALGLASTALGYLIEDYNTLWDMGTARSNVNVGGNSVTYPALTRPTVLHAGTAQISGLRFPPPMPSELSEWSQVGAITGADERTVDLLGIARPITAAKNSWGAIQYQGQDRDTGTTYDGSTAALMLPDAGRVQFKVPTADATEIVISVYVYREANYAGTNPRLIVKQPGQADDTTTDAAAASQWNLLTTTLTPADEPDYVIVELASLNTAAAGNYAAFFDALFVDSSPTLGDLDNWITDRIAFEDIQAAGSAGGMLQANKRGNKQ